MDHSCHECGDSQSIWMVARCTNPSKTTNCGEAFCFKCLSQIHPQLYSSIFKGLWWLCPVCMGLCKCETCSDPVKKAEYQRLSKRKIKQRPKPTPVEDSKPLKLRSGTIHHKQSRVPEISPAALEDPADGWICSRCSIVNSIDDIECIACCCHRKRNTRKRSQDPVHEDKFQAYKETRRATEQQPNTDDKVTPVK